MLSAKEARKLAGVVDEDDLKQKIERLLNSIRSLAQDDNLSEEQRRRCATGYQHRDDADLWTDGGYNGTEEWKKAKEILENLGYEVSFFYEEKQFVNMYTLIKW